MKHPDDFQKLIKRGENLYTLMRPLKLAGVPFGRRMVVFVQDGKVMLHSPFIPAPAHLREVERLGKVTDIVTPTVFHDTFLDEVVPHYPDATYYCVPGAEKFLGEHVCVTSVDELSNTAWSDVLEVLPMAGMPKVNECAFYHRDSRSLLVSDLLFNVQGLDGWWLHTFAKMLGFDTAPSPSRLFNSMIKDKAAFTRSLKEIKQRDFDQILTSHFNIVSSGGSEVLSDIIGGLES